ncbi:glutamate receptor ionotropic, kainate 1-like [Bradysia coprophila]|uniref:glutamate receptor ionotropic, kainate 1-like n=1 Tax=Bradysia coprophila TaxID=38358 RepID=UPI00187DAF23|nr:glutamate receptor ionotropic, kainate 1-like [Bradysia coprophila]
MRFLFKVFPLFAVLILHAKCDTLQNATVTVATLLESPYTMHAKLSEGEVLTGNARYEGYIIDLLDLLAKNLGFSYDVQIVEDHRYGAMHNGKWDGLIGEVRSGRAKIGAAAITITSLREAAVDFTIPFINLGISILYKRSTDGKALPFTNVEELAAAETIKVGCVLGGATYQFFKNSDIPAYKRIYERMESADPPTFTQTVAEGIERVQSGDYAFFMESTSLDYAVQHNCDLQQVGGLLDSKGFGLVVEQGSPFRELLSQAILLLQESGDLAKLHDKWWKMNAQKCDH